MSITSPTRTTRAPWTAPPPAALEVRDLTCRFGGLVAVNAVSFEVRAGEIFGLIGPNGAGKTTLFNTVTGLNRPASGQVRCQGQEITRLPPHRITALRVARTFQNIRLFGDLAAIDNVMIARHLHTRSGVLAGLVGLPSARREERAAYRAAEELLALVGLADRAGLRARTLAYGDQRRLEIARALATEPRLLLLDEPAAGMNLQEKQELSALIRSLRERLDLTIVLIEHHVPLVMGLCDRVAVLDFGQLIALDAPEAVRADRAVIEAYLGDAA